MTSAPARSAGILVPLSSMPSTESWGIGEFTDIPRLADWLQSAGLSVLQLLPLNETARDEFSPYSPLTAMALDPQFISLRDVEDFAAIGGDGSLMPTMCRRLTHARFGRPHRLFLCARGKRVRVEARVRSIPGR